MTTGNLKDRLPAIRAAMNAALADVAKKLDLSKLEAGHITYDPRAGNFTVKVEGIAAGGVDPEEKRYDDRRQLLNLPARGATFRSGHDRHTIVGMKRGGSVLTRTKDGRTYRWRADLILAALALAEKNGARS